MPGVGFDTFFKKQCPTVFKVQNIAKKGKRIKIFTYPIPNGEVRDLMEIPHVSEADIRHSLLKGELNIKIRNHEIIVIDSNIDLLQFDPCHKQFLLDAGITTGLTVSDLTFVFKQNQDLIGTKDGINTVFYTAEPFINGTYGNNEFHILIRHNGRVLQEDTDYIVVDNQTIEFKCTIPDETSELVVDYMVEST